MHRLRARQVLGDFLGHAPLRARELEWQRSQQLLVQAARPAPQQRRPQQRALALRLRLRQLLRQQLLELQPLPRRVAVVGQ